MKLPNREGRRSIFLSALPDYIDGARLPFWSFPDRTDGVTSEGLTSEQSRQHVSPGQQRPDHYISGEEGFREQVAESICDKQWDFVRTACWIYNRNGTHDSRLDGRTGREQTAGYWRFNGKSLASFHITINREVMNEWKWNLGIWSCFGEHPSCWPPPLTSLCNWKGEYTVCPL